MGMRVVAILNRKLRESDFAAANIDEGREILNSKRVWPGASHLAFAGGIPYDGIPPIGEAAIK